MIMEPGTALVADTMSYVCKVLEVKKIADKNIAITSGSKVNYHSRTSKLNMPINVYSAEHRPSDHSESIDISGYTCMEEDYIYKAYQGSLNMETSSRLITLALIQSFSSPIYQSQCSHHRA